MQYDVKQLTDEAIGLRNSRETALQQYHQICGALTIVEQMIQRLNSEENKTASDFTEEQQIDSSTSED